MVFNEAVGVAAALLCLDDDFLDCSIRLKEAPQIFVQLLLGKLDHFESTLESMLVTKSLALAVILSGYLL